MTTSSVPVATPAVTGSSVASYSVSEDALTKKIQRVTLNDSAGAEITSPTLGTGVMTGSVPVTVATDDVMKLAIGAKADAKSTATDTTAVSGISIWKQISASVQLMVFGAGTAAAAQRTTLASDDPAVATLGATSGAAVVTDVNGTIQQYLRGIIQFFANTLKVQGDVASGGSDSGNPVKGGAVYNSTLPTYTTGQRSALQVGTRGSLNVTLFNSDSTSPISVVTGAATGMTLSGAAIKTCALTGLYNGASIDVALSGAGAVAAGVQRVTLASDDPAVATLGATTGAKVVTDANGTIQQYLRGIVTQGINVTAAEYETVAASQTTQILGATGAAGDYLEAVLIVPGTTAAGAVSITDGNGSAISIFAGGGTTALADLAPIYVPLGMISVNATTPGWKVTTGTNVTAIGIGNFT